MSFVNAHRLGDPKTIENTETGDVLRTRPLIVRFSSMPDKERVQKKLSALREVNRGKYYRHRIFVTDQLPKRMEEQRKSLVADFKEARRLKKKAKWSVDKTGDYCLYVDKKRVIPSPPTEADEPTE